MLKRIFMKVSRGMTDSTAICVFPWEKPLVEEIHGGSAVVVSIDELCNQDGVSKVEDVRKVVRLPTRIDQKGVEMKADKGMSMREQLEAMLVIKPEDNPMNDVLSEFNRMMEKYGMHPEVKMSVVEKVYGNARNFRLCMRDYANGRTPEIFADDDDLSADGDEEKSIAEMTVPELKAKLEQAGVKFAKNAGRPKLEALLQELVAEPA